MGIGGGFCGASDRVRAWQSTYQRLSYDEMAKAGSRCTMVTDRLHRLFLTHYNPPYVGLSAKESAPLSLEMTTKSPTRNNPVLLCFRLDTAYLFPPQAPPAASTILRIPSMNFPLCFLSCSASFSSHAGNSLESALVESFT